MQITAQFPRIALGQHGWRFPAADGYVFGSEGCARRYAAHPYGGEGPLDLTGLEETDTRPTQREVQRQIEEAEAQACGLPAREHAWQCRSTGPWDEYFSCDKPDDKWPEGYRWIAVYVVTGGSEGLYLHVDALFPDGKRINIFLGKTCSENREAWEACYASAARIAWMLQA